MPPLTLRPQNPRGGGSGDPAAPERSHRDERSILATNLAITVVLLVAVGAAAILLARTVTVANKIDKKAQNIARSGRGINVSTDSIVQLNRTNTLAESILRSALPLDDQLKGIVGRAQSIRRSAGTIDAKAGSINSIAANINGSAVTINQSAKAINGNAGSINNSAQAINSTAGAIGSTARSINGIAGTIARTARGINSNAGSILSTARVIDRDAADINDNLDRTRGLARAIKVDTGNILGQAGAALDTAACIDAKLDGGSGSAADCRGTRR